MDMHDENIDQLFRSQLSDMEEVPSPIVWKNIAAGLNNPAVKRSRVPYLRIAASVVVVLGAGLWLVLNQTQPGQVNIKHSKLAAQIDRPLQQETIINAQTQSKHKGDGESAATLSLLHSVATKQGNPMVALHHPTKNVVKQQNITQSTQPDESTTNIVASPQQQLAAVNEYPHATAQPVVPDEILPAKAIVAEEQSFKSTANTAEPVKNMAALNIDKPKTKRHGIHSLGDVVNLVVAKVDKREDKLIEFTDTDDDEAEITGINLGLFRVKKQK